MYKNKSKNRESSYEATTVQARDNGGLDLGCSGRHGKNTFGGLPGGTVVKNPPANAGDMGLIPGPGRSHMPRSN